MTIPYTTNHDVTIPFSDSSAQMHLATGVEQTVVVPGTKVDKYSARFGYNLGSNVFVRLNGVAAVPVLGAGDTLTYCELNPGADGSQRNVQGEDELSFITEDAAGASVSVSFRKIPG